MAFYKSPTFKYLKNLVIGVGAAVVLIGALFKILSLPGANEMLTIGLCVEAGLFLMLGLLPPEPTYYWEKMYPNLNIAPGFDPDFVAPKAGIKAGGSGVTQQLDKVLEDSMVESDVIKRLGTNLSKFSASVDGMSDIGSAMNQTGQYTEETKKATAALTKMTNAYNNASMSAEELAGASAGTKKYHEQVQLVSKNLAQLNAIYELELNDTNSHLKTMNQFYGNMKLAMSSLSESVDDAKTYQEQLKSLSKNLTSLNSVYGSMLSAMANPMGK